MKVCPYLYYSFEVLGKKWNGLIIHYLSLQPQYGARFTDIKQDLAEITPRALSLKLSELMEFELVQKHVSNNTPVEICYQLTEKGIELTEALGPLQEWARKWA